ncbi:MAG: ABC transporter substrate-binding protein [Treponema sp.]|nr:ABC transporter substrate-binding protein [Treponema sp.]
MSKLCVVATILITLLVNISCDRTTGGTITDRAGRQVTISGPINRIVSTAPSNTEIIVDLGMAHKLVAIDRHSVNIDGIPERLPLLDFFFPDAEVILGLQPDIIIASGHNPTGAGDDPFRLLSEAGIPVVYIPMSRSIDDIYLDIAFLAELLHVQQRGERLIETMRYEIARVTRMVPYIETPRTVYFEISPPPDMMTFGRNSFIDDMISIIGAQNIFGDENWLVSPGAEAIISRNPDVILTNVSWIEDPIGDIKNRPGFNHINAVINNRVYQIDNDSSVRASPRIVLALHQMIRAVYPELHD